MEKQDRSSIEIQQKAERAIKLRRLKEAEEKENLPHIYAFNGRRYKWAREFSLSRNFINIVTAANQLGKALENGTLIPTPDKGFVEIQDIKPGDMVFGSDGKPCKVLAVPFKGQDICYEITFDDGSKVIASENHLWKCKTPTQRFKKKHPTYNHWVVRSTKDIFSFGGEEPKPGQRCSIPYTEEVITEDVGLFDPYLVGLLLGDGCFSGSVTLSNSEPEIISYVTGKHGAVPLSAKNNEKCSWRFNGMQGFIKELGLWHKKSAQKFIPKQYLSAGINERWQLFHGLMDTDGTAADRGVIQYSTVSKQLCEDFCELVASLGGVTEVKKKPSFYKKDGKRIKCQDHYQVTVKITKCPFLLPRKAKRYYHVRYRYERLVYKIKKIGKRACTCLTVDSPDSTFLCTKDYIVTHNSSEMIRKCIDWATNTYLWPELWPQATIDGIKPNQFWYLYPSKDVATAEFETKWKEFLPKDKNHPVYGWKEYIDKGKIHRVVFNTGVIVYFKTYKQDAADLQAGTVFALFADEELPWHLYDELSMRVNAVNGYLHFGFTATLCQRFWKNIVEDRKALVTASVWQISLYDCQYYDDGTPSKWTDKKIQETIDKCSTPAQVQRRVFGKFVADENLKYPTFSETENVVEYHPLPANWMGWASVDYGGGGSSHPAAISVIAVNPEYTMGRTIRLWRGDGITTTAQDVIEKYLEIIKTVKIPVVATWYDWAAKDLATIAQRLGLNFLKANKSHEDGEAILNALLKNRMLKFFRHNSKCDFDGEYLQAEKIVDEFSLLLTTTSKRHALDDLIDVTRYGVVNVPWDWEAAMDLKKKVPVPKEKTIDDLRRERFVGDDDIRDAFGVEEEFDFWNNHMEF